MKYRQPTIRFRTESLDPACAMLYPYLRGQQVHLTLPHLPDDTIQHWHGFLRDLLVSFEDHYEAQLARAYGWSSADKNEEEQDEEPWGDEEI